MNHAAARSAVDREDSADRLLTPQEAAERLGTSPRFVRRLVFERRIAYCKLGRYVRFHPDDVDEYIAANRVEVGAVEAGRPAVTRRRR
jgi:excisionase family DNA binding protein